MMIAVFFAPDESGESFTARCETFPGWYYRGFGELTAAARHLAEDDLREHITETLTFAEYIVPPRTGLKRVA